jgi:hypothetical protein
MPGGIDLIPAVLLGMAGAALTIGVTYLIAARWKHRCGMSYCIAASVFYAIFFIAAFEYGILEAIRTGRSVPGDMLDLLILGHAAITAIGVTIFTLLVFGLFVGLRPPLEGNTNPLRKWTGCAAFCLIIVVFLNPIGAVDRLRAVPSVSDHPANLASAAGASGKAARAAKPRGFGLPAVFPEPGFVQRVKINGGRITHYVSGDVEKRTFGALEAYARKALAHRLYFDNGKPGPIVIRSAKTGRHIATRHPNGRFLRQIASRKQKKKPKK